MCGVKSATGSRRTGSPCRRRFCKWQISANPSEDFPASLVEIAAQVERVYNGVYLLATLKRDEMLRERRQEELDKII